MGDLEVKFPVIKLISAWCAVIFTSTMDYAVDTFMTIPWDKLGQCAVFIWTLMLIWERLKIRIQKETKDGSA